MNRILILRGGALGDFIVTLPAIAAVRRRWPRACIELAGNATAAAIGRTEGLIDAVHSQHESRWSALFGAEPLPPEFGAWLATFDLVVTFWPDPDGALARHFPRHAAQQFLRAPAMPTRAPAAAHYLDALAALGLEAAEPFWQIATTVERSPSGGTRNGEASTQSAATQVAVHPGSGSRRKNWPRERWIELIASLPWPVLLVAGEAELDAWTPAALSGTALERRIRDGTLQPAVNLPLAALVARLSACRWFVGHDSGVSHLAAAAGVPCVLLFGPTDPAMWAPPARHVTVLQRGADLGAITVEDVRRALGAP